MKANSLPVSWLGVAILGVAFVVNAMADSVDVSPNSAVGNTPITVTASGFNETGNMAVFFYLDTPSGFEHPGYWGVCFGSGSCQIQTTMPYQPGSHTVYVYGYTNISPSFIIAGTSNGDDVVTNYVEAGAATNSAARYYRIKLVP